MANFNPQIQVTNDPNFTRATSPIDVPDSIKPRGVEENRILPKGQEIGDRSAEYEGKAAGYAAESEGNSMKAMGDLFANIVGIGDFIGKDGVQMVRKDIEDRVYQVADAERQRYTAELEAIKARGGGSTGVGVANLMDSNAEMTEDVPDEISELPETLGTLQAANQAGKLTKTDYNARLLAAAKDIRARYPGFKNEIDQEFAKVTGQNPANAYVQSLIRDINSKAGAVNSESNKLQTFIMQRSGFQGAREASQKVQTGEWGRSDVIKWAAPQEQFRIAIENKKAIYDSTKMDNEEKKRSASELLSYTVGGTAITAVNDFMQKEGLNSEADADAMAARNKAGGISAQEWVEKGDRWNAKYLQMRQAMLNDAQKHGLTRTLGLEEVTKQIDAGLKPMQDIRDRIFAKDSGGIYKTAQSIRAMGDEDTRNLLTDSIVGGDFRAIQTMQRIGGDNYLQSENLRKIVDGLSGRYGEYQKRMIQAIQTQTDMKNAGVPLTLNRIFDEYNTKMKDATSNEKRKMNNSVISEITRIADPNVPDAIKVNYAITAFSPSNRGFISRLNPEAVDSQGNEIKGQNAVFQKLTSPEITKEMARLGKTNPELWKNYVDWTKETLGNELLRREMSMLGEIRNPAVKVGWDSDNKRLKADYVVSPQTAKAMGLNSPQPDAEFYNVQRSVNRINNNFSNYKNVAEASGQNVEAFLLGTIVQSVGPQALSQVDNIPADIMRQIGLTQLKKKNADSNKR